MANMTITRDLAFATGQDKSHALMRKRYANKGYTPYDKQKQNAKEYAEGVELTNRLLMHVPFEQGGLMGIPEERLIKDGLISA